MLTTEDLQERYTALIALRTKVNDKSVTFAHLSMFLEACVITQDENDYENPYKFLDLKRMPYIGLLAKYWLQEPLFLVAKSRQMMVTWVFCACFLWDTMFRLGRLNIMVSRKEDDADKLINRAKSIYLRLPDMMKAEFPVRKSPGNEIGSYCNLEFLHGSRLMGLSQDPNSIRSNTASNIFSDEMAFQERARETFIAMKPTISNGGHFTGVSTPNGKEFFYLTATDQSVENVSKNLETPDVKDSTLMDGVSMKRNSVNGFCVMRLHYSADRMKNTGWVKRERVGMPEDAWQQEQEINFTRAGGRAMYPEFSYNTHVKSLLAVQGRPLLIGIDWGFRHPAMVITQINGKDQLCVLDEWMPSDITVLDFGKGCLFKLKRDYNWHFRNRRMYTSWFTDPAGNQRNDKSEMTSIQIFKQRLNTFCRYKRVPVTQGVRIVQNLLLRRSDMSPGMLIDKDRCPILIEGFMGGYEEMPQKLGFAAKEMPVSDDYYSHTQDALRYIVVNRFNQFSVRRRPNELRSLDFDPLADEESTNIPKKKLVTGYY